MVSTKMRFLVFLSLALLLFAQVLGRPSNHESSESSEEEDAFTSTRYVQKATCGYASCPITKEGVLNIHLIPHSHDDVGWLKTLDQYYYGSRTNTQKAGVQYILDSVIDALVKDPSRRFIYVETAFFWKWWNEQHDIRRHQVKGLVAQGRLEFVGGAWSMNDEATTHYQSIVDQFTWGLRKLNDTFGECGRPRAGWQIDPFGHSREQANLFAAMGYDGLMLGRIDYQDKDRRRQDKEMEMIWRGNDDIGQTSDLFTGVMFNTYSPPPGFCFDILCSDDPVIDDPTSPDYNVDIMVKRLREYLTAESSSYKTNHLTVTMGGDFTYMHAEVWYKNMDKLIKYVNQKEPSLNLFYSTPSCYIKSVHDANIKWPTKRDDFFPYASDPNSYWTGYFTSRPTLKYFERKANNFLQVCKQLYVMTNLNERDLVDLDMLRSAMGVMQHHDAVTGTEKQHVARDYARILDMGVQDCLILVRESLNQLMSEKPSTNGVKGTKRDVPIPDAPYLPMTLCELNITQCHITESTNNFVVTVYNPLGHVVSHYVKIPVSGLQFTVQDPQGSEVPTQLAPISQGLMEQLADGRNSTANAELTFLASNLPPLGYRSYYITVHNRQESYHPQQKDGEETMQKDDSQPQPQVIERGDEAMKAAIGNDQELLKKYNEAVDEVSTIGNELVTISVDPETGFVNKLFLVEYNMTIPLKQELLYYEGMIGNNEISANRSSGAYIFRPKSADAKPITSKPEIKIFKGPLVEEIHQKFSSWASQVVRVYKGNAHVEFEWLVGPIPIDDNVGKEVISRFSTNMDSRGIFWTDSNGRQLLQREVNHRPTWNLTLQEPVGGNYYPVTSMISIHDSASELDLSVLTDRAQGGSSLRSGELELMVHRRLLHDDAFGVGEALNETAQANKGLVARGTHYLYAGKRKDKGSIVRKQLILSKQLEPYVFITPAENLTLPQWQNARNEFSGLVGELPSNIHIFTAEPWKADTILLRLEHFLEKSDDPETLSKTAYVRLDRLFSGIEVLSYRETTLAANQYIEDSVRLQFEAEAADSYQVYRQKEDVVEDENLLRLRELKDEMDRQKNQLAHMQRILEKFGKKKYNKHSKKLDHHKRERIDDYLNDNFPQSSNGAADAAQSKSTQNKVDFEIALEPMQIRTFIIKAKFME